MEREKKGSRRLVILLLLLILLLIGLAVWLLWGRKDQFNDDDFYDPSAVTGILPGMTEAEIQEELNRVVEEGMLNISIASDISFEDGKAKGKANIYNTEANHYIFKVAITLDDSGETVYESGGIRPGQYIEYIKLADSLEAGEYPATATFTAYTQDTLQIAGSAAAQVTLYVKK